MTSSDALLWTYTSNKAMKFIGNRRCGMAWLCWKVIDTLAGDARCLSFFSAFIWFNIPLNLIVFWFSLVTNCLSWWHNKTSHSHHVDDLSPTVYVESNFQFFLLIFLWNSRFDLNSELCHRHTIATSTVNRDSKCHKREEIRSEDLCARKLLERSKR